MKDNLSLAILWQEITVSTEEVFNAEALLVHVFKLIFRVKINTFY